MRGYLDGALRPILPIAVNRQPIELLVDTGFTDTIAIGLDVAKLLSIHTSRIVLYADTAGGRVPYRTGTAVIKWFGRRIPVEVLVWQTARLGPVDGFLGIGILVGHVLVVDFNEGYAEVRDPAQSLRVSGP